MRCSDTNSLNLLRIDAPPTDPRDPPIARRLLEFLRERGLLDPAAVERAAKVQLETRQRIDVIIAELGLVPAPEFMAAVSDYFGYPILSEADLRDLPVAENLETPLSADFLRRNGLLPIKLAADALVIATTDPFNTETLAAVAYLVEAGRSLPGLAAGFRGGVAATLRTGRRAERVARAERAGCGRDLRQ